MINLSYLNISFRLGQVVVAAAVVVVVAVVVRVAVVAVVVLVETPSFSPWRGCNITKKST